MGERRESKAIEIIQEGDHIQVFDGRYDGDTGELNQIMVVWRDNKEVWAGPVEAEVLRDRRVVVRRAKIRLPMSLIKDFHTETGPE